MKTVLIVDDELSLRLLVSTILTSDKYVVEEATDGDEGWSMLWQHRPAVALLDVQMPGRTGLELARAIKDSPELASTKVIMLSAKAQRDDVQRGLDAGADTYLTKPFSPIELITVVEQALGVDR